ncbi:MAG: MBL fold metallo-hydrolase [Kofleriaceae bacterium]
MLHRWSLALSGLLLSIAACGASPRRACEPAAAEAVTPRTPISLTYLGVAGWQITDGRSTILVDPYFSRPAFSEGARISPDEQAIAKHAPAKADAILVGHSHVDHVLDVPAVARRTGAQVIGTRSTARYALASGVPAKQVIPVLGGEDYAFDGFSVRVLRSLHSALGDKHIHGGDTEIAADPVPPLTFDQFAEGGTLAYLVRIGGHEILILSTANFIERELEGLRPDIAVVATGLRQELHDYSCRLMRALGQPAVVFTNHFDPWTAPLGPKLVLSDDARADLAEFTEEIHACAPNTRVVVPEYFEPNAIPGTTR